jgi:hypothetical protein
MPGFSPTTPKDGRRFFIVLFFFFFFLSTSALLAAFTDGHLVCGVLHFYSSLLLSTASLCYYTGRSMMSNVSRNLFLIPKEHQAMRLIQRARFSGPRRILWLLTFRWRRSSSDTPYPGLYYYLHCTFIRASRPSHYTPGMGRLGKVALHQHCFIYGHALGT